MPYYTLKCHTCYATRFCIRLLLALFGSDKTFLWIFVLCLCTSCAWHSPLNECEWCFVFRFLPLSIHLWHWEPHQPVQHQWNTSAPCSPHLHPAERASVCGGRNQHQWGEGRDLLLLTPTDIFCCFTIQRQSLIFMRTHQVNWKCF